MLNLYKRTTKLILIAALVVSSAGQECISPAKQRDALRPMAAGNHGARILDTNLISLANNWFYEREVARFSQDIRTTEGQSTKVDTIDIELRLAAEGQPCAAMPTISKRPLINPYSSLLILPLAIAGEEAKTPELLVEEIGKLIRDWLGKGYYNTWKCEREWGEKDKIALLTYIKSKSNHSIAKTSSAGNNKDTAIELAGILHKCLLEIQDQTLLLHGAQVYEAPAIEDVIAIYNKVLQVMPIEYAERITGLASHINTDLARNDHLIEQHSIFFFEFLKTWAGVFEESKELAGILIGANSLAVFCGKPEEFLFSGAEKRNIEAMKEILSNAKKCSALLDAIGLEKEKDIRHMLKRHNFYLFYGSIEPFLRLPPERFERILKIISNIDPDRKGVMRTLFMLEPSSIAELFKNWIEDPIDKGQYRTMNPEDIRLSHLIDFYMACLEGLPNPRTAALFQVVYEKAGYSPASEKFTLCFNAEKYSEKSKYKTNKARFEKLYDEVVLGNFKEEKSLIERMREALGSELPADLSKRAMRKLFVDKNEHITLAVSYRALQDTAKLKKYVRILVDTRERDEKVRAILEALDELAESETPRPPDGSLAEIKYARAMLRTNTHRQKRRLIKEALRLNPDEPAYHTEYGGILERRNRYKVAESEYKRAIELDNEYLPAHEGLGQLYRGIASQHLNVMDMERKEFSAEVQKAIEQFDFILARANKGSDDYKIASHLRKSCYELIAEWEKKKIQKGISITEWPKAPELVEAEANIRKTLAQAPESHIIIESLLIILNVHLKIDSAYFQKCKELLLYFFALRDCEISLNYYENVVALAYLHIRDGEYPEAEALLLRYIEVEKQRGEIRITPAIKHFLEIVRMRGGDKTEVLIDSCA